MARPGQILLTCWLTVVLTGTVVTHRHMANPQHTHGFGWATLRDVPPPTGMPYAHRHFVLLGIEFCALSGLTDGGSPDGTRPAAGEVVPEDGGCRAADLIPDPPHAGFAGLPSGSNSVACAAPTLSPPYCLFPHISHSRTGVLRS